jgi:flagellar hook-basal body complex protein FliE
MCYLNLGGLSGLGGYIFFSYQLFFTPKSAAMALCLKILLLLCCAGPLLAQPLPVDTLTIEHEGRTIFVEGIVATQSAEFKRLRLDDGSYPIIILPRETCTDVFNAFNAKDRLTVSLEQANLLLRQRDTLNEREIQTYQKLMQIQQQHTQLCESTNQTLNQSITALNQQLETTRELAKDCAKGKVARSIWGVALGGGIGLGLGIILGVIVAK